MDDPKTAELKQQIEDCKNRVEKLTTWEVDFLTSIENWLDSKGFLSEKQEATLDKIWDKVTTK